MQLAIQQYEGFWQDSTTKDAGPIQCVSGDSDFEQELLRWSILHHPETITDAEDADDVVYVYELGDYLGNGVFKLNITRRSPSEGEETGQVAAALLCTSPTEPGKNVTFIPTWLLSEHLHLTPPAAGTDWDYKPAYGELTFGEGSTLPHRELFGLAAVPGKSE